jgi:hypothetical protein
LISGPPKSTPSEPQCSKQLAVAKPRTATAPRRFARDRPAVENTRHHDLRHQSEARRDLPVMLRPELGSVLHGLPSASMATFLGNLIKADTKTRGTQPAGDRGVTRSCTKIKVQASEMKAAKFCAVFSQRKAMRLKRLILPTPCSRARSSNRPSERGERCCSSPPKWRAWPRIRPAGSAAKTASRRCSKRQTPLAKLAR